jgi:hypothetical protein
MIVLQSQTNQRLDRHELFYNSNYFTLLGMHFARHAFCDAMPRWPCMFLACSARCRL